MRQLIAFVASVANGETIRHFGFGWLDFLRTVARRRIAGALVPTLISIAVFRLV